MKSSQITRRSFFERSTLTGMKANSFVLITALAFAVALPSLAHEGDEEDKSPIPVTLGATWQAILKKQAELQGATASQSLPMIHRLAFRLRDLCNTLPGKSRDLPPDKQTRVTGAVKNIAKLAEEFDKTGDAKDQKGTQSNLRKLDGLLKLLAGQYDPAALADTSKEPPPDEAASKGKEHAHSDHESKRGGILMMLGDYHIEGVQVDNQFRVYFFNEFTRPIPVRKITGKLVLPLAPHAKPDADEPTVPLKLSQDGLYLFEQRPAKYPDDFLTVRLLIDGRETPFGFPIFKTTEVTCEDCGTKTVAGVQAISACGMCSGKLTPKESKIDCTKCPVPVSYNPSLVDLPPAAGLAAENAGAEGGAGNTSPMRHLLEQYYAVQKALASDDFKLAQAKSKELATTATKIAAESKTPKLATISQNAQSLSEAKDLKAARKAFAEMSVALIDQLSKTPNLGAKYYILHCPMAKVGNGDWIQPNPATSNPYFGSEMLRCGTVKKGLK